MSLILLSAYVCFHSGIETRKVLDPRLDVMQNARIAIWLMAADLRAAVPLDKDLGFVGMRREIGGNAADNIDFATLNFTPGRPRESDFCQVSYYVNLDPDTRQLELWRRRNPRVGADPLSGGSKEQIATGLRSFECEYFDGLEWHTSWGDAQPSAADQGSSTSQRNSTSLPEAVRIVLAFESDPANPAVQNANPERPAAPPFVFKTVVRLNLVKGVSTSTTANSSASGVESGSSSGASPGNTTGEPRP